MALGPDFSSQVWSIVWVAIIWPRVRFVCGVNRCIMWGKKPSMLEKWCRLRLGTCLNCFDDREASSIAVKSPIIVTIRAESFREVGIVIGGVLMGKKFMVIKKPAMMLPQASRLMGLITAGLFSLIGGRGLKRGWFIDTKKMIRRL